MMPSLEQYECMGMDVLVSIRKIEQTESGILYGKIKVDPWFTIASRSSIVKEFEIGDRVMLRDPTQSIKLTFDGMDYLQIGVHNVLGRVPKDLVSMIVSPNGESTKVLN